MFSNIKEKKNFSECATYYSIVTKKGENSKKLITIR